MEEPSIDTAAVIKELTVLVSYEAQRLNRNGAVVGPSGGINSAAVAAQATRTLAPERVSGLIMPQLGGAPESKDYALTLARQLVADSQTAHQRSQELKSLGIDC